jgi:hypothetical protein
MLFAISDSTFTRKTISLCVKTAAGQIMEEGLSLAISRHIQSTRVRRSGGKQIATGETCPRCGRRFVESTLERRVLE